MGCLLSLRLRSSYVQERDWERGARTVQKCYCFSAATAGREVPPKTTREVLGEIGTAGTERGRAAASTEERYHAYYGEEPPVLTAGTAGMYRPRAAPVRGRGRRERDGRGGDVSTGGACYDGRRQVSACLCCTPTCVVFSARGSRAGKKGGLLLKWGFASLWICLADMA
eukprot:1347918-Rhodomonas_salina.1